MRTIEIPQAKISHFMFCDTRTAWLWLIIRAYLGWIWIEAGWEKVINHAWVGDSAGTAVTGYLNGALQKTSGAHPDVSLWYAYFIEHFALPHATAFSYMVTFGEIAVGLGLIVGLFTALAAFFGSVMNFSYLFAGTVSINPQFVLLQFFLILAWRVAGWYGLDRFLIKYLEKRDEPVAL